MEVVEVQLELNSEVSVLAEYCLHMASMRLCFSRELAQSGTVPLAPRSEVAKLAHLVANRLREHSMALVTEFEPSLES